MELEIQIGNDMRNEKDSLYNISDVTHPFLLVSFSDNNIISNIKCMCLLLLSSHFIYHRTTRRVLNCFVEREVCEKLAEKNAEDTYVDFPKSSGFLLDNC